MPNSPQIVTKMHENLLPPRLIAIGGGPGSGKSFFYEVMKQKGQLPDGFVMHDPDLVMESIP